MPRNHRLALGSFLGDFAYKGKGGSMQGWVQMLTPPSGTTLETDVHTPPLNLWSTSPSRVPGPQLWRGQLRRGPHEPAELGPAPGQELIGPILGIRGRDFCVESHTLPRPWGCL